MAIYSSDGKLKLLHKRIMFSYNVVSLLKLQNNEPNFPSIRNILQEDDIQDIISLTLNMF